LTEATTQKNGFIILMYIGFSNSFGTLVSLSLVFRQKHPIV
jgi:hypothetical protein